MIRPPSMHRLALLDGTLDDGTPEVRWHLVVLAARLTLTAQEAERLMNCLDDRLHTDNSRIVRVMALRAASHLCAAHAQLAGRFEAMMSSAEQYGIASLKARAKKLGVRQGAA